MVNRLRLATLLCASRRTLSSILLFLSVCHASSSSSSWFSSTSASLHRQLADDAAAANDDATVADDYFQYDLSQFSVRFEKCQYVKMYDNNMAENADSDSPLALKHFVIYRLCPSGACEPNSSKKSAAACDSQPHGVYTVDVEQYLQTVIEYQTESFKRMCENCQNGNCDDDTDGSSCTQCTQECQNYQNLANNGYVDAAEYIQCKELNVRNDDDANADDASQNKLYIGPRCNSTGKIVIGLFEDENCWKPSNKSVENVLGANLWYNFLKQSYYNNGTCLSCQEDPNNENANDAKDKDDVNEMCEDLYKDAAKCESDTGLSVGFVQMNREDGDYQNQVENEFLACTFINSLIWNSYTETGEINVKAPQDEIIRLVTQNQTITLSLLSGTIVILLGTIFFFERKIKQNEPLHMVAKGDGEFS